MATSTRMTAISAKRSKLGDGRARHYGSPVGAAGGLSRRHAASATITMRTSPRTSPARSAAMNGFGALSSRMPTVRRGQIHPRRRPERPGQDEAMRHAWQTEGKSADAQEQAAIDAANLHHRNRGRPGDSWRHTAREGLRAKSVCGHASLRPVRAPKRNSNWQPKPKGGATARFRSVAGSVAP
jgi:hypothetical protein